MTVEVKPLVEITHEAVCLLCKHIGIVNTIRFINQYATGYGNYTEERREMFESLTVEEIVAEIGKSRKH